MMKIENTESVFTQFGSWHICITSAAFCKILFVFS